MNNVELYVDGQKADAPAGVVFSITRQNTDINNPTSIKSDRTSSFDLPATDLNLRIFEAANQVPSQTAVPYKKIPARVVHDGVESLGYLVVDSATKKGIQCSFYFGNINFFAVIEGKKISELDLSALIHPWLLSAVVSSRNHKWNAGGYIYPLVDTVGDVSFNNILSACEWRWLTPWIFVKRILDQIFKEAGFTYEGKFLASDRFENLITNLVKNKPHYGGMEFEVRIGSPDYFFPHNAEQLLGSNFIFNQIVSDSHSQAYGLFVFGGGAASEPPGGNDTTATLAFKPNFAAKYSFQCRVNVQSASLHLISRIVVSAYEVGAPSPTKLRSIKVFRRERGDFTTFPFTFDLEDIDLLPTEALSIQVIPNLGSFTGGLPSIYQNIFHAIDDSYLKLTNVKSDVMVPGLNWKIQENLYDMTQTDFIKQLCQRFCLIPETDDYQRRVHFYQLGEVVENFQVAKDWTKKLAGESQIQFRNNNYAQRNELRWGHNEPEEFILPDLDYGYSSFAINDDVLDLKKVIVELKFNASRMVTRFIGQRLPQILFHDPFTPAIGEWNDVGPRLLQLNLRDDHNVTLVDLAGIFGGNTLLTTNVPFAYFIDGSQEFDLGFENALLNDYKMLVNALQKYKGVTDEYFLSIDDVINHEFIIPIFNDKHGAYFIVNKLSNWVNGKVCKVDIFRI